MKFNKLKKAISDNKIYFHFSEIGKKNNLVYIELEVEIEVEIEINKMLESIDFIKKKFKNNSLEDFFGDYYEKFESSFEDFKNRQAEIFPKYLNLELINKWELTDIKIEEDSNNIILVMEAHFRIE